jgi:hypothetical protein
VQTVESLRKAENGSLSPWREDAGAEDAAGGARNLMRGVATSSIARTLGFGAYNARELAKRLGAGCWMRRRKGSMLVL